MRRAALAVSFLTVFPVRLRGEARDLGAAVAWFPVVGGLIGAIAGAVRAGATPLVGREPASVLAAATLVAVTGALHQDGLADCADGLGVRGDRERRLEVMRDPAIGVFGALALVVWTLLMVTGLDRLDSGSSVRALIAAAAVGRWAALLHARLAPPARPDGLGAGFGVGSVGLVVASVIAVAVASLLLGIGGGLAALAGAATVALLVTRWARRSLRGRTGDTLGATVALVEATVLLVAVGFAGG
ncbi:MAG: adenosylcobinamide-GDP ribazoletransferase [Actinobacteria bacterium]|nr:adenosylcobinamide-GDP ribazoletransferase [Actinomycetota bacterium]